MFKNYHTGFIFDVTDIFLFPSDVEDTSCSVYITSEAPSLNRDNLSQ